MAHRIYAKSKPLKNRVASATPMTLSYSQGRYVLLNVTDSELSSKLFRDESWRPTQGGHYCTSFLKAAIDFRKYADDKTERIFKRLLNERYETLPKVDSRLRKKLDPHQAAGVDWILSRKRSYIAHAPGAGKTITSIVAALSCENDSLGQIVFIVPPSLIYNWEREVHRVLGWVDSSMTVGKVTTTIAKESVNWNADFILVPDSMLIRRWVQKELHERDINFLCVDEASRFKEPFTKRSLAFYGGKLGETIFPGIYRRARHVIFLDGSPMPNRPIELWAPTFALSPGTIDYMDYDDFGYRYCGAKLNAQGKWEYLYSSHERELKEKLQKDFMHVVSEEALSHPERRRSMVFLNRDVRSEEQREWERIYLTDLSLGSGAFEEKLSQGDLARFRRELGLNKVPLISRYVKERLDNKNESILLFAWHREVIARLAEKLLVYRPLVVMGGVSNEEREKNFRAFQEGRARLLILNIQAAGRGVNLQKADRVIFGEFSWTDELNRQCEKRASRKGSEKDFVRCEYLIAPGSLDEVIANSLFTKERRVRRIIG